MDLQEFLMEFVQEEQVDLVQEEELDEHDVVHHLMHDDEVEAEE
jgi:hypothetical protein